MKPGVVLAICLAGLAAAVAVVMSDEAPRPSGANRVSASGFSIDVPPRSKLCQDFELVAGDTASMVVAVANLPEPADPPRLDVAVVRDGRAIARGRVAGGYPGGPLRVELAPAIPRATESQVCIANRGDTLVGFGSGSTPPEQAARVDGVGQLGRIRIEYFRPGSESWWALAPTVAHRFGLAKGDVLGSWSLWAAGLVLLLALGMSVRVVAAGGER